MIERFNQSLALLSMSWAVLKDNKSLAVYPVISAVTSLIVILSFAWPVLTMFVATSQYVDAFGDTQLSISVHPLGWFVIGVGYFLLMYVGIFCNAALIFAANERFTNTGPGTLASGFSGAWERAGAFVPWALLSATVTLILRVLEERSGRVGRIVYGIIGIAWTLVTYMVVPVLVLESEPTTGRAIRRSTELFKQTWGENVIGNMGLAAFNVVLTLVVMAMVLLGVLSNVFATMVLMFLIAAVVAIIGTQLLATMSGIFRVALYRFAVDGVAPGPYASMDFSQAFRPKAPSGWLGRRSVATTSSYATGPTRTWQPPPAEPVDGAYGIAIPGQPEIPGIDDDPTAGEQRHFPDGPRPSH